MKKLRHILYTLLFAATSLNAQVTLTNADMQAKLRTTSPATISIHDPSAVFHDGQFYIWGSHLGVAKTSDMQTFTGLSAGNATFRKLSTQGAAGGTACGFADAFSVQQATQVKNAKGETVSFPNFDAAAYCARYAANKAEWLSGDMWAPDIIYNTEMQKWCMYMSLNGDNWSSIIVLLTAPSATGPFTYQGPVVMGGFNGQSYNGIKAPTYADTDMDIALGEQLTSTPKRYIQTDNGKFWPNCIDPCVFYDEEGQLWMAYGSWSGGIFMLKLDNETGLRDYTYTYTSDYDSRGASGVSDPYFGLKIAGGYYVSGEGSYIQRIGDHYYLWMSYGGFAPDGGYDMRVFRSRKPTGPYVDQNGNNAVFTNWAVNFGPGTAARGMRQMGAYNRWGTLQTVGECAQGHNSVVQDGEGRTFLVYHTKFNDGTIGHQVRVHQLWLNSQGWPVAAPFIYTGQTETDASLAAACPFAPEQLAGTYNVLLHKYGQNHNEMEEETPLTLTLGADGTVKGDMTGTWAQTEGTAHMQLRLGGVTYYGVFIPQSINGATTQNLKQSGLTTVAFTALSAGGTPLWGYKLDEASAVSVNWDANDFPLKANQAVSSHQSLMFDATDNATVQWHSSRPDIISTTGKYNPTDETTQVELTRTISCGSTQTVQSATVNALKATTPGGDALTGLVAYYNMDETPLYNQYKQPGEADYQRATLGKLSQGTAAALVSDWSRMGQVVQLAASTQGNNSYVRMPNPLKDMQDLEGFTLSLWVLRQSDDPMGPLWGMTSGYSPSATPAHHLFFTGNAYLDYDNSDVSCKLNDPATELLNTIPVGKWTIVTLTVGPENGVRLYVNGTGRNWSHIDSTPQATTARQLPYDRLTASAAAFSYIFLGGGSGEGSPQCRIDELMLYNRELSSADVRALNTLQQRVTDFTVGPNGTALQGVKAESQADTDTYTLSGQRTTPRHRGVVVSRQGKWINLAD